MAFLPMLGSIFGSLSSGGGFQGAGTGLGQAANTIAQGGPLGMLISEGGKTLRSIFGKQNVDVPPPQENVKKVPLDVQDRVGDTPPVRNRKRNIRRARNAIKKLPESYYFDYQPIEEPVEEEEETEEEEEYVPPPPKKQGGRRGRKPTKVNYQPDEYYYNTPYGRPDLRFENRPVRSAYSYY